MLVCPQCQHDNLNDSQFCQKCGISLSQKACPDCGTIISFEDKKCTNCGAFTATVWWALISQQSSQPIECQTLDSQTVIDNSTAPNLTLDNRDNFFLDSPSASALKTIEPQYLDRGQRYRLINDSEINFHSSLPLEPGGNSLRFQGLVMDCQPLQKSVLKSLLEDQGKWLNSDENKEGETQDNCTSLWKQMGIPQLAFPYLSLQEFCPLIPRIHSAWYDDNQEVVLLEERSSWQLLSKLWASEDLPILQIVYWLNEMASLWTPLAQVHCCQSLLVENNLRVDEDQTFGLLRLYRDQSDHQPTLQDLGRMWQQLLYQSKQQNWEVLAQLLEEVISGQINKVEQLSLQLQHLAEQEQPISTKVIENKLFTEASSDDYQDIDTTPLPSNFFQEDNQFNTEAEDETIIEQGIGEELSTGSLPMQLLSITDTGYTDTGRLRRHNEDYFVLKTQITKQQSNQGQKIRARGLYIVCDGMGGHAYGRSC